MHRAGRATPPVGVTFSVTSLLVSLVQHQPGVPGLPGDQGPAAQLPLPAELCTLGRVLGELRGLDHHPVGARGLRAPGRRHLLLLLLLPEEAEPQARPERGEGGAGARGAAGPAGGAESRDEVKTR